MTTASYSTSYGAVYYGGTPTGKRLHLADTIFYATKREQWAAKAYCGVDIITYREEQAPPSRVSEFCHSCFRALAWEVFEAHVLELAASEVSEVSA